MSNRFGHLPGLAKAWMADLWRVGFYLGGRKEAGEISFPPEQTGGRDALPVRSENGQTLLLVLGAYAWDPRGDGRTYPRTEVQGVVPRTDRAQLAALCVLEGAELPKREGRPRDRADRLNPRRERLDVIRRHLRGEHDELNPEEDKMVAFVRLLLWSYRPDLDHASDEGIELFVETCNRVARVAEATRQLSDYLEFGTPDADTRPNTQDAQMDVYAAELRHIAGMKNREIAEKLGRDLSPGRDRSSKQVAATRAERGTKLYVEAMGAERWERYRNIMRRLYRSSN